MTGRHSARWDRIDSRPRRYVLAIGRDRIPRIHDNHGCDVTQCKLAASLYEHGECVRLIDIGQHGHITIIRTAANVADIAAAIKKRTSTIQEPANAK